MNIVIANSNPTLNKLIEESNIKYQLLIKHKNDLNYKLLKSLNPQYIFFPHWSYIIPEDIYTNYTCIVFHMTDLPYGRGGSPLQNLIVSGQEQTKISAIQVDKEIDSGPVYLKRDLSLCGTAEEIFIRAGKIILKMMNEIIKEMPVPKPQKGEPFIFKRRKPEMSNIYHIDNIEEIYNHIRMLDAEGYPKAFIEGENFRFEFSRASLKSDNSILADVRIFKK